MTQFDFCRTLGILKGQIEDKKIGAQNRESTIPPGQKKTISFGFWFKWKL